MNKQDLKRLIGAGKSGSDYIPVAVLLSSGYGCAGFYNNVVNEDLDDTCVLLNARLVELQQDQVSRHRVNDFNDFIADIVDRMSSGEVEDSLPETDMGGTSIPLTAIPFSEIALAYPVATITELLERVRNSDSEDESLPSFLDFDNKSIVLKALRTKLW